MISKVREALSLNDTPADQAPKQVIHTQKSGKLFGRHARRASTATKAGRSHAEAGRPALSLDDTPAEADTATQTGRLYAKGREAIYLNETPAEASTATKVGRSHAEVRPALSLDDTPAEARTIK